MVKIENIFSLENLLLCVVVGFVIVILSKINNPKWSKNAPSLITTVGIACTFVGLSRSLYQFDLSSQNQVGQLNLLLIGFKGAFIPSALAIVCAVFFKLIVINKQKGESSGVAMLGAIQNNLKQLIEIQKVINVDAVQKIESLVVSDEKIKNMINVSDIVISHDDGCILLSYDLEQLKKPILLLLSNSANKRVILNYAKSRKIAEVQSVDMFMEISQNIKIGHGLSDSLVMNLHEVGFNNKQFKTFFVRRISSLIKDRVSFAIQGSDNLIMCAFYKDKVPEVSYIAWNSEVAVVKKILDKNKICIINSGIVADQLSHMATPGMAIPELLTRELGELTGMYYDKILPFIK